MDECLKKPCDDNGHCTNTDGSFFCECNNGYAGDGFSCIGKNCFCLVKIDAYSQDYFALSSIVFDYYMYISFKSSIDWYFLKEK